AKVAVLVPWYNEDLTVADVVAAFQQSLPGAAICVYDNNSTDDTREAALAAGAEVRAEPRQGKGHVIRCMFADVEADIYVMVVAARPPPLCTFLRSPATHQNEVPFRKPTSAAEPNSTIASVANLELGMAAPWKARQPVGSMVETCYAN